MAHKARHQDNPYIPDLPEVERIPSKIWELLRRNAAFKKAVARLSVLDGRVKAIANEINELRRRGVSFELKSPESESLSVKCQQRTEAQLLASRMLANVGRRHSFAAAALQWIVPEPYFEIRYEVIADNVDLTGKQCVPTKAVKIEGGLTPDQKDWQTFVAQGEFDADSRRNIAGCAPMVRGPRVTFTVFNDPRLQGSKVDGIQEWRGYHATHGPFTLADSWRHTPLGFRRTFCWLWRHHDSREKNPLTGCRTDAPQEHETSFFQTWRLMDTLVRTMKTGQLAGDDYARSLSFDDLAKDYRIFAFPACIRSRMEARRLADWLFRQLAAHLPAREPEILGSPLQWDMLLMYDERRRQGDEHLAAVRYTFDHLYLQLPNIRSHAAQPVERSLTAALQHRVAKAELTEAESTRWHSWLDDLSRMNSPESGKGLVQLIFPSPKAAFSTTTSSSEA